MGYIKPTPPCQHVRAEEGEFWIVLYEEDPPSCGRLSGGLVRWWCIHEPRVCLVKMSTWWLLWCGTVANFPAY